MWELVGFAKLAAHARYPKPETLGMHAKFDDHFSRIIFSKAYSTEFYSIYNLFLVENPFLVSITTARLINSHTFCTSITVGT